MAVSALRPEQRAALVAALGDRDAAIYNLLCRKPMLSEADIAGEMKAAPEQVRIHLAALQSKGLIEKFEATKRRPFGAMWRPTPDRIETVGDWVAGGYADRGYADLAAIQRDYPAVKSLADPADGAEAAKHAAGKAAELEAAKANNVAEEKRQREEIEARRAKHAEERAAIERGTAHR